MFCGRKKRVEFEEPMNGAGANIVGWRLRDGCFERTSRLFAESFSHG